MGAELYLLPVNRYETHLVQRLEQGAEVLRRNDDHPHIKLAADLFHMALEEDSITSALEAFTPRIGYVQIADHNRRLPGHGQTDFTAALAALRQGGYDGWITVAGGPREAIDPYMMMDDLPDSIAHVKAALDAG
jgi:sugar phosphate isomerase/epimerase